MHHPTDRIIHTMAFVMPVVEHWLEWKIAQWVHPTIRRPIAPSANALTTSKKCIINKMILGSLHYGIKWTDIYIRNKIINNVNDVFKYKLCCLGHSASAWETACPFHESSSSVTKNKVHHRCLKCFVLLWQTCVFTWVNKNWYIFNTAA